MQPVGRLHLLLHPLLLKVRSLLSQSSFFASSIFDAVLLGTSTEYSKRKNPQASQRLVFNLYSPTGYTLFTKLMGLSDNEVYETLQKIQTGGEAVIMSTLEAFDTICLLDVTGLVEDLAYCSLDMFV